MSLEPIFAKINPFKINGLQISVFLHNQVNSRLSWYATFLSRHIGMKLFRQFKKKKIKLGNLKLYNKNKIKKNAQHDLIYTGCQIINKNLFKSQLANNFSVSEIWNELINKDELYGYESLEVFYHMTYLEFYKELLKNK